MSTIILTAAQSANATEVGTWVAPMMIRNVCLATRRLPIQLCEKPLESLPLL
jgi:hypothetical protein